MKFIHCADIHLDTPLQGLAQYPGAPVNEIRNATRRSFEKVMDAAVAERVDFLIIAGDLYDTGLKSFESALFFNKQMTRLKDAGVDVYLVYGNHDAASKLIKQLRPPTNVHVFRASEPQTFVDEKLGIAVHGQSFATPEITEDLAAKYPPPVPGLFNIGVLHTNLGGVSEHANYAPCSLETLQTKGYHYWALGHVHNRQVLGVDPYIIYPGNIQGRHGREQGEKSCELLTVSDAAAISREPILTSVVPWFQADIDLSDCGSVDQVYEMVRARFQELLVQSKERVTAVRLRLFGTTDMHAQLSRDPEQVRNETISIANECGNGLLWLERVQIATVPPLSLDELLKREDPIGEVVRMIAAVRQDPLTTASWEGVAELQKKLPNEIAEGPDPTKLDALTLDRLIEEAEGLLLSRLSALEVL
jgi:DNA repair exonuclease SbcCD nuclease subunit